MEGIKNNIPKCNVAITAPRNENSHLIDILVNIGIKADNIFFKGESFSSLGQTILLDEFSTCISNKLSEKTIQSPSINAFKNNLKNELQDKFTFTFSY